MTSLDYNTFKPLVNDKFKIKIEEPSNDIAAGTVSLAELDLTLEAVEEGKKSTGCESFSLMFRGTADRFLPQQTYTLHHKTLGEQDVFLVPVGETAEDGGEKKKIVGYRYQAVFSRLKEKS